MQCTTPNTIEFTLSAAIAAPGGTLLTDMNYNVYCNSKTDVEGELGIQRMVLELKQLFSAVCYEGR